jgi:hypothetical protein
MLGPYTPTCIFAHTHIPSRANDAVLESICLVDGAWPEISSLRRDRKFVVSFSLYGTFIAKNLLISSMPRENLKRGKHAKHAAAESSKKIAEDVQEQEESAEMETKSFVEAGEAQQTQPTWPAPDPDTKAYFLKVNERILELEDLGVGRAEKQEEDEEDGRLISRTIPFFSFLNWELQTGFCFFARVCSRWRATRSSLLRIQRRRSSLSVFFSRWTILLAEFLQTVLLASESVSL